MQRSSTCTLAAIFIGCLSALADGGTAVQALKVAQKAAPGSSLVSLAGEHGEPRPAQWTALFLDPQARGGVREVVVAGGAIVSQRTPLQGYAAMSGQAPVQLAKFNIDSDKAFNIANEQAKSEKVAFNWLDYTLKADDGSGNPVWFLRLFDNMGAQVGSIQISAGDGLVLVPLSDTVTVRNDEKVGSETGEKMGGLIGTVSNTVSHTATKVKDSTLRVVGTVQEILTGKRTIGPKEDDDN